ncbi:MAG: hypothetical protein RhofKO_30150 [Rhodothermales bacterium]
MIRLLMAFFLAAWLGGCAASEEQSIFQSEALPQQIVESERWDGTRWLPRERVTTTYIAPDQVLSSITEKWRDGEWLLQQQTTSVYDTLPTRYQLREQHMAYWVEGTSQPATRTIPVYKDTLLVQSDAYSRVGDAWERSQRSELRYTDDGLLETIVLQRPLYDADGDPEHMASANADTALAWLNEMRTTYTYAGGRLETTVIDRWNDAQAAWLPASRAQYRYDAEGREAEVLMQEPGQVTWHDVSRKQKTYDDQQRLISELTEAKDDLDWTPTSRRTVRYE